MFYRLRLASKGASKHGYQIKTMNYYLSFHTVFILNENIKWLEEFIIYYRHLGFEHFYLYHNEGTNGDVGNGGTSERSKYGFPISTDSTTEDIILFEEIMNKFGDYITYVQWQPRKEGVIVYGQEESVKDCIEKYGSENEWIAFMDFDEFIFSAENINIPDFLRSLDLSVSCVKLIQKKFLDRFLTCNPLITQEFRCMNDLPIDIRWAPKNIIRCKDFVDIDTIHTMNVKNKTIVPNTSTLRFNHYNLNAKQLKWMKGFYNRSEDFVVDGIDDSMSRYYKLFLNRVT